MNPGAPPPPAPVAAPATPAIVGPPALTASAPASEAPAPVDPLVARALADEVLLENLDLLLDLDVVRLMDALTLEEVR